MRQNNRRGDPLTPRQQQVLRLMSDGHTFKTAARELRLSPATVGVHCEGLRQRLGAKTLAHAVKLGYCGGYLR
jgi:DNA-binding CsgD family transcriptional regulator